MASADKLIFRALIQSTEGQGALTGVPQDERKWKSKTLKGEFDKHK